MTDTTISTIYNPTPAESAARTKLYKHLETMRQVKTKALPHFANGEEGHIGWLSYIDRSERYLNGYVLTRDEQGKESWQSNLNDNSILAKARAIAAGVGLRVPEMSFSATNSEGIQSNGHADIFKGITQTTFNLDNPTLHAFLQVWQIICHGTIFEYEGYKTGSAKVLRVDSFDSVTGEVTTKSEQVMFDGKPFSCILNPQEFFWWNMQIRDVQEQPRLAWVQHFTKTELEREFSKYQNFKYVKDKQEANQSQLNDTLYWKAWQNNVENENDYEVIRMYSKEDDNNGLKDGLMGYEVWANGVPLLRAPLLWGQNEKMYPFAKQILQPFANTNFFVGMSLPAIMEAYQQAKLDVLNSLLDKLYRAVNPQKLIGLQNKDLFDVQQSIYSQDDSIYVPDINAVKFMDHSQINQGELMMYRILDQGIESTSVDRSQQGLQGTTQKTAHQAEIEDQRARELKGSLYLSLEDLWLQKTRLRTEVVLTHYLKDKAAQEDKRGQIITVEDFCFYNGTRGTLDIHVATTKAKLMPMTEIMAREQAAEQQGMNYKIISILEDFLDDWVFDVEIIPQSFKDIQQAAKEKELMDEVQQVGMVDPGFLMANKDHYVEEIIELHGHEMSDYKPAPPPTPPGMPGMPGAGGPAAPSQTAQPSPVSPNVPQEANVLGL